MQTPLHDSLALGANPDPQQQNGKFTALIYAAASGDGDIITQLIDGGADVNYRGANGWNSLSWAVAEGNADAVEQLIDAGADVNVKSESYNLKQTALIIATEEQRNSKPQYRIVSQLLAAGADATIANNQRNTPLDIAQARGHHTIVWLLEQAARGE